MFQNESKSFKIFQKVSKSFKTFQKVSKSLKKLQKASLVLQSAFSIKFQACSLGLNFFSLVHIKVHHNKLELLIFKN